MAINIGRRDFITALGGAAIAWPLSARAQQPGKLPTIGFLGTATPSTWGPWVTAFVQRLHELGWVEGRTVAIEYRWAEGHSERFSQMADEFVRLKVDVIFTSGGAVLAAMRATSVIPIVFVLAIDPVGSGFVASLARPGDNVTGMSSQATDLAGKRLELLREVAPGLRRVAIMADLDNPGAMLEMSQVQAAAHTLDLDAVTVGVRRAEDIPPAFETLKDHADALYVVTDPLIIANQIRIYTLALNARLPTTQGFRAGIEAGALMAYGPNVPDEFRGAGNLVDKVLRGTKPADIPVEQPTKFELVINLRTAKVLGLNVPQNLLTIADEVIE